MTATRITEKDRLEMKKMYSLGTNITEIAEWFGVARGTIQYNLRKLGIELHGHWTPKGRDTCPNCNQKYWVTE